MKILTEWLRSYLPTLEVGDAQLAEDLTLRGIAVEGIIPLEDATGSVFDMDITTNRVDAMNHYGIAREAAAIYNLPLKALSLQPEAQAAASPFPVRIDAPAACGRFTAQVIRDVRIAPSQGQIARWFAALGQKPISNAVDISNFILLGMGHPNHVFDLDRIEGGIVVRFAHPGELLMLLDGTTRTLVAEDLVIADEVKALSLAGVIGGFHSAITAQTRNILVEAAWFDPATIRATSRRHLIHTDASHRYERGADFAAPPVASALVAKHLLESCGGQLAGTLTNIVVPKSAELTVDRPPIALSISRVQRLLGQTLDPAGITGALVVQYLTALGCSLTATGQDSYQVALPSWRLDLSREIDLIEEIARVYGYNRFSNTLPTPAEVIPHPAAEKLAAVRTRLLALGFSEALSSTFASTGDSALFAPATPAVALDNPLNEEAANLRPSLLPGMVTMLAHNLNRDLSSVRLFEAGTIFSASGADVEEAVSLSLGLTGTERPTPPLQVAGDTPFYELKGAVESILDLFETPTPRFEPSGPESVFELGRAAIASFGDAAIAHFGQLVVREATHRKLRQPIYLGVVDLAALLRLPLRRHVARELSRYQAVERDFSFVFPNAIRWQTIADAIQTLRIAELLRISPEEVWRNEEKFPGVYSILIRTRFQSNEGTLRDEELVASSGRIITALETLGGRLRSA